MRINELISESKNSIVNGDFQNAILKLNHALIIDSENDEIKKILLKIYSEIEDSRNAISTVNDLLKRYPDDLELLLIQANCLNDLDDFDNSLNVYNRILSMNHDFSYAYGGRGILLKKRGDLDNALLDLNKAINYLNDNAFLYANRGAIHIERQNFEFALKDFDKALKINKHFDEARINRAFVLRILGKYKEAIKDLSLIKSDIEIDSEGYHQKGIVFLKNDKLDKALDYYNKAISIDDSNVEALYSRAMLYSQLNDFDKAFEDLDNAMLHNHDHFKDFLLNGYADVYRKMKAFDKAITFANSTLDFNPNFYWANITLAEIYGDLGNQDEFLKYLEKGLEAGFDINELDSMISNKYSKNKDYKALVKKYKNK